MAVHRSLVVLLALVSAVAYANARVPTTSVEWYACPLFTYPQPSGPSAFLGADLSPDADAGLSTADADADAEALHQHIAAAENAELLTRIRSAAAATRSGSTAAAAAAAAFAHPHGPLSLPRTPLTAAAYGYGGASGNPLPIISAECADMEVPLYYPDSIPAGSAAVRNETITVFVKRYRAAAASSNTMAPQSMWFLQGGPGDASDAMEQLLYTFHQLGGNALDVYTMDHRGVGRSTRLGCDRPQAETPGSYGGVNIAGAAENIACNLELSHSEGTNAYSYAFTADNAARDLGTAIELTKGSAQVFVYGVSYGTMWTQRYAALYPDQATAIVLDGVVTLQGMAGGRRLTFDRWERNMNGVMEQYLSKYCAANSFCRSKLTDDPLQFATEVFNKLYGDTDSGGSYCAGVTDPNEGLGIDRPTLRLIFGIVSTSMYLRQLIPATLYRLNRCDANDIFFMQVLVNDLSSSADPACLIGLDSQLLQNNIGSSELWDSTRSLSSIEQQIDQTMFASGLSVSFYTNIHNYSYPLYPPDPRTFNQTLNAPNLPVLLLNGDLDPQTPIMYANYTTQDLQGRTKSAQFVQFPGSAHGTSLRSPTTNASAPACAITIMMHYIASFRNGDYAAGKPLDTSCLAKLKHVQFSGDGPTNILLIGTPDLYDGQVPIPQPLMLSCGDNVSKSIFDAVVGTLCAMMAVIIIAACWLMQGQKQQILELQGQIPMDGTSASGDAAFSPVPTRGGGGEELLPSHNTRSTDSKV